MSRRLCLVVLVTLNVAVLVWVAGGASEPSNELLTTKQIDYEGLATFWTTVEQIRVVLRSLCDGQLAWLLRVALG